MVRPIQIIKEDEQVFRVEYFEKVAGWIAKARATKNATFKYRAMSVHGRLGYFNTINSAKCFVISNYN